MSEYRIDKTRAEIRRDAARLAIAEMRAKYPFLRRPEPEPDEDATVRLHGEVTEEAHR